MKIRKPSNVEGLPSRAIAILNDIDIDATIFLYRSWNVLIIICTAFPYSDMKDITCMFILKYSIIFIIGMINHFTEGL